MRLFFVFYAIGPAMLGYALAYLLHHPDDWTGPAVIIPLGAALTVWVYRAGTRWLRSKVRPDRQFVVTLSQFGGAATGVIIFLLMYFVLIE